MNSPPPWKIEKGSHSGHCCFSYSIIGADGTNIAEIIGDNEESPNLENARLIARAPETEKINKELIKAIEEVPEIKLDCSFFAVNPCWNNSLNDKPDKETACSACILRYVLMKAKLYE